MRSEAMENRKFSTRVGNNTQNLYLVSAKRYLMTVVVYNFGRTHAFCACSNILRMTTEHAYTGGGGGGNSLPRTLNEKTCI
jgi:hypothetical protein